ncbi:MAG: hypothetical protein CMJ75_18850 [Planctomycetaceae bacterium]|nr:hypothetical protein [Planctomycetaceae bacterium]
MAERNVMSGTEKIRLARFLEQHATEFNESKPGLKAIAERVEEELGITITAKALAYHVQNLAEAVPELEIQNWTKEAGRIGKVSQKAFDDVIARLDRMEKRRSEGGGGAVHRAEFETLQDSVAAARRGVFSLTDRMPDVEGLIERIDGLETYLLELAEIITKTTGQTVPKMKKITVEPPRG